MKKYVKDTFYCKVGLSGKECVGYISLFMMGLHKASGAIVQYKNSKYNTTYFNMWIKCSQFLPW